MEEQSESANQNLLPPVRPRSRSGSSGQSGAGNWWDNYCDRSSYEVGEQEFWSAGRDIRKIPIVSTDISELGFTSSSSDTSEVFPAQVMAPPSPACNAGAKALATAKNVLQVRIDLLDADEIDSSYLHTIPEELDGIRNLLTDFMVQIRNFLEEFSQELDPTVVSSWEEESKSKYLEWLR